MFYLCLDLVGFGESRDLGEVKWPLSGRTTATWLKREEDCSKLVEHSKLIYWCEDQRMLSDCVGTNCSGQRLETRDLGGLGEWKALI